MENAGFGVRRSYVARKAPGCNEQHREPRRHTAQVHNIQVPIESETRRFGEAVVIARSWGRFRR
jgi:hypothetical protein